MLFIFLFSNRFLKALTGFKSGNSYSRNYYFFTGMKIFPYT